MMKNLRELRKQQGMTQLEVQMKTGIEQTLLSKYENGERVPTVENLMALARLFRTSMDYLMGLTGQREPYPPAE